MNISDYLLYEITNNYYARIEMNNDKENSFMIRTYTSTDDYGVALVTSIGIEGLNFLYETIEDKFNNIHMWEIDRPNKFILLDEKFEEPFFKIEEMDLNLNFIECLITLRGIYQFFQSCRVAASFLKDHCFSGAISALQYKNSIPQYKNKEGKE